MEKINLAKLYDLQADLDKEIAKNHGCTYESTHEKRLLALIIEIGELANETRCFKFWSNKGPSPKEITMDEYADGLHFFLSLGIPLKTEKMEYELSKNEGELTLQFHEVYRLIVDLKEHYDLAHYTKALQYFLNIVLSLGYHAEDITKAYLAKLEVNHTRQATNY